MMNPKIVPSPTHTTTTTSCRYSTVWHIASFHAWQKSVQEAYHYYCQIGTAVYSSIIQSSLMLSATITCFILALFLTLIYSTALPAAEGQKINIQSASVVPNCLWPAQFSFNLCAYGHTKLGLLSTSFLCILSHAFLSLLSFPLLDLLLFWPILKNAIWQRGNCLVSLYQLYSPGLCCTHLLWNTHK